MNKNNFMKAMAMIDEDLIKESASADKDITLSEKTETVFSEDDHEVTVSGVEVYHRPVWRKFLAAAAAFVIAAGAVGGGAYYFAHLRNDKKTVSDKAAESTDIVDDTEYDSIYSRLKANRKDYKMSTAACTFDSTRAGFPENNDMDTFFALMDQYDMKTEIAGNNFIKTARSIAFFFGTDEDIRFVFRMYENGCFSWTEKNGSSEKTTYHRLSDEDDMMFSSLMIVYDLDSVLNDWNAVTSEEIYDFVDEKFTANQGDTAYKHFNDTTWKIEISDKDALKEALSGLEWERSPYFNGAVYYDICGIDVSDQGYMQGSYNGYNVIYTLTNNSEVEKLRQILQEYLKLDNSSKEALIEELQNLKGETTAQWLEGPYGSPQGRFSYDNIARYYTITDPEGLIDEIASFEWENCSYEELEGENTCNGNDGGIYSTGSYEIGVHGYGGKMSLYPSGYMSILEFGYYKLRNSGDVDRFRQIFGKYWVMDESSVLAEKICSGITNYDNLKAHLTHEVTYDGTTKTLFDGTLSVDAKNEKLYRSGTGALINGDKEDRIEIVMNGHDNTTFRTTDIATGELVRNGSYHYSNGYLDPPPDHYIYLCKNIEKSLAPRMAEEYTGIKYEIRTEPLSDGNTRYIVKTEDVSGSDYKAYNNDSFTLILNEKGQILSFESSGNNANGSFRLDDYVFDSPDFTMEDVEPLFDEMQQMDNQTVPTKE